MVTAGDASPIRVAGGLLLVRHSINNTTTVHSRIYFWRPFAIAKALTPAADDCTEPTLAQMLSSSRWMKLGTPCAEGSVKPMPSRIDGSQAQPGRRCDPLLYALAVLGARRQSSGCCRSVANRDHRAPLSLPQFAGMILTRKKSCRVRTGSLSGRTIGHGGRPRYYRRSRS